LASGEGVSLGEQSSNMAEFDFVDEWHVDRRPR
jgi:hypothetical protein